MFLFSRQDHLVRVSRSAGLVGPPNMLGSALAMEISSRPSDAHPLRTSAPGASALVARPSV